MPETTCGYRRIAVLLVWLSLLSGFAGAQADPLSRATALQPDALVDAVLEANPSLAAARAAARAARVRIGPAGALDDPMLTTMAAPRSFGASATGYGIELSQRLPWPGKRDLREQIAKLEARAVTQSIANTRLDLVQLAREAFADWYLVHAQLEVNRANRELWREVREIAEINYANGTGGKPDVLQADMEYQMLDHRQVVLERRRAEVLAMLNRLSNREPGATLPPPAPLGEPPALQPLGELRKLALARRTELDAAEAELGADGARVELAERALYPDFQVSTGYNRMWAEEEMRWTVGVGINIPLDRGKRRAITAGARAEEMESRWRLQDLSLQIVQEVEQAHARVAESRHLLRLTEERLLPLARANLEAARTAYRSRTGSLESLLRAQRGLFETELNHETARADYFRSMAALERAVGGWDGSVAGVPGRPR